MDEQYNSKIVTETLKKTLEILASCNTEYRLLGSVVTASILGKQHRNLGDLDFIADRNQKSLILNKLYDLGYRQKQGMFSFAREYLSMDTLEHDQLLEIGFFWGRFLADGSFLMGNKKNGGLIDPSAVEKQKYELHNITFYGLPERIIARGILMSSSNPKRKKELALIKEKNIQPQKNGYIHVFILGIQVDWVYYFSMSFLNILGNIRIRLGLAFDPWR